MDQGDCFLKVNCEKKVGVDPYVGSGRGVYHEECEDEYRKGPATHVMTSDEFFETNRDEIGETFDIVFIDGLHEAEQVACDTLGALDCLNEGGAIVVHDCLPLTEEAQQVPRGDVWGWNGDAWKAVLDIRETMDIGVYTVDTDQGCAVFDTTRLGTSLSPHRRSWEHFDANRKELMNIISIPEFLRIL